MEKMYKELRELVLGIDSSAGNVFEVLDKIFFSGQSNRT